MRGCYTFLFSLTIVALIGCASSSPYEKYSGYNCRQLAEEKARIALKIEQMNPKNRTEELVDAAVTGFAIGQGIDVSDSRENQQKKLQDTYDFLDAELIKKDCKK